MYLIKVDSEGDIVYHTYLDDKNEMCYDVVKDFRQYFYFSNRYDFYFVKKDKVFKVNYSSKDKYELLSKYKYTYLGDLDIKKLFILERYGGLTRLDRSGRRIRWGVLDIELSVRSVEKVDFKGEGNYKISVISVYDSFDDKIYSFCLKNNEIGVSGGVSKSGVSKFEVIDDCIYIFKDEELMLKGFIKFLRGRKYAILTGWNVWFDINSLCLRVLKLLGQDWLNSLSLFNVVRFNKFFNKFNIFGLNVVDYMEIYKKFKLKEIKSYKLDNIANLELGIRKGVIDNKFKDFYEMWRDNFRDFIDYNRRDVDLVVKLEKKLMYLDLIVELASIGIENINDAIYTSHTIDNILIRVLDRNGFVVRSKDFSSFNNFDDVGDKSGGDGSDEDDESFVGGYVFDVKPCFIDNYVFVVDVVSLYPTLISLFNISPETMVGEGEDCGDVIETGCSVFGNKFLRFRKDRKGILPLFEDFYFKMRVEEKSKMKSAVGDEKMIYNTRQMALKVIINALYGILGYKKNRFYNKDLSKNIAVAVTSTGRLIIQKIGRIIKKDGFKICAGDTDSIMFYRDGYKGMGLDYVIKEIKGYVDSLNNRVREWLVDFFNINRGEVDRFKINFEKVCESAIFLKRKRYALKMVWNDGDFVKEYVYKGLDVIKTNITGYSAKIMDDLYKMILDGGGSKEKIVDKILYYVKNIRNCNYLDLGFPFVYRYRNYKVNCVFLKGCKAFDELYGEKGFRKFSEFGNEIKGYYFYVISNNIYNNYDILSVPEYYTDDIKYLIDSNFKIDYDILIDKVIYKKVKEILELFNISLDDVINNSIFNLKVML